MTTAIIGSGNIGHAIATQFGKKGIDVLLANSRGPDTLTDTVRKLGSSVTAVTVQDERRASVVS